MVPAEKGILEVTVRSVALGFGMAVLFSAAAAYIALKLGQGIESAIPISILAIGASALMARKSTLLENVNILTIGATSGILVGGSVFTMPAIFVLGLQDRSSFLQIFLVPFLGAILGVLMLIPFRRYFVAEMHGKLPFPEGTAITEILMTGERGGQQAKMLVTSMGIGFLFDKLALSFGAWRDVFTTALVGSLDGLTHKVKAVFAINTSAAVLGLGYIIGVRYASIICAGSFLGYFVLIPLVAWFGTYIPGPLAEGLAPISQMSAEDIFSNYVRFIGIGGIFMAGIISIVKMSPVMVQAMGKAFAEIRKLASGGLEKSTHRTDSDIPMGMVAIMMAAVAVAIWIYFRFSVLAGIPGATRLATLSLILTLVITFLFAAVSAWAVAMISITPISGMTLTTLIVAAVVLAKLGLSGPEGMLATLLIGGVVCTALSMTGSLVTEFKVSYWLGRDAATDPVVEHRRRGGLFGHRHRDDPAVCQGLRLHGLGAAPDADAGATGQRHGGGHPERDVHRGSALAVVWRGRGDRPHRRDAGSLGAGLRAWDVFADRTQHADPRGRVWWPRTFATRRRTKKPERPATTAAP